MASLLFGRTQDAYGTPFDNGSAEAIAAGISSNTVQEALIEVKNDAINNDRYPFPAIYGANAGVGRYLEIFPALASFPDAPFIFPENSVLKQISLGVVALSTCTIGIFKTTDLVNPVHTISLSNELRKLQSGLSVPFMALDELAIRVTSGTAQKPFMRIWVNTAT